MHIVWSALGWTCDMLPMTVMLFGKVMLRHMLLSGPTVSILLPFALSYIDCRHTLKLYIDPTHSLAYRNDV